LSFKRGSEQPYTLLLGGGGGLSAQGYPQVWKFSGSADLKVKRPSV